MTRNDKVYCVVFHDHNEFIAHTLGCFRELGNAINCAKDHFDNCTKGSVVPLHFEPNNEGRVWDAMDFHNEVSYSIGLFELVV